MPRTEAPYRVIQWGTGAVGKYCIRTSAKRPDLEIVGARVFSDAKDGKDVGEIAGIGPIGAKAHFDKQAIYDLEADIVLYTPLVVDLDDICAVLASGKNLITPSGFVFLKDEATLAPTRPAPRADRACMPPASTPASRATAFR
jgi:hypothetical protein